MEKHLLKKISLYKSRAWLTPEIFKIHIRQTSKNKYQKRNAFEVENNKLINMHLNGICKLENDGSLKTIKEKPEYDFLVNTGMNILSPDILRFISKNKSFDMTDLIKCLKEKKEIGVFLFLRNRG